MKVKVPREIEVAGFSITIDCSEESTKYLQSISLFGEYIRCLRLLRIRNDLTQQEWANTFWHEIEHIIDDLFLGRKLEEEKIDVISNGLHQVAKQLGIEFDWSEIK